MEETLFREAIQGTLIVLVVGLILIIYIIFRTQKEINKWETIGDHTKKCDDVNCMKRIFNDHDKGHIIDDILQKCKNIDV